MVSSRSSLKISGIMPRVFFSTQRLMSRTAAASNWEAKTSAWYHPAAVSKKS